MNKNNMTAKFEIGTRFLIHGLLNGGIAHLFIVDGVLCTEKDVYYHFDNYCESVYISESEILLNDRYHLVID